MNTNENQKTNVNLTDNCKLAKLVGETMRKTEQLSAMYSDIHHTKHSFDNGFLEIASQSLSGGITMIRNKLSRYETAIQSMVIATRTSTDQKFKKLVLDMETVVKIINNNLQELSDQKLPVYMTDQEACYVGLGYYGKS